MHINKNVVLGLITLALLILKKGMHQYATNHEVLIEKVYSRGFYPVISKILTSIANVFPFSIGEVLFLFLVFIVLCILAKMMLFLFKKELKAALDLLMHTVLNIVIILCFFDAAWLLNNYRPDFEDLAHLSVEKSHKQELVDTFQALIIKANTLREGLSENEEGLPNDLGIAEILSTAYKGYGPLSEEYDFFRSDRVKVKGLLSSRIQTMSGYTGVYLFFIGEPAVNTFAPIFTIPHTACHEIAHQQGFAQEEAANYIGFLACTNHPSAFFQYSGYLAAVSYVGNSLYLADSTLHQEMSELYSDAVLKDLRYDRDFWRKHVKGTPSKVVNRLNDTYLKSYNQEDGIKSYGKFVDLLIADFVADKLI